MTLDVREIQRRAERIDFDKVLEVFGDVDPDPDAPLDLEIVHILSIYFQDTFEESEPSWSERQAALDEIHEHLTALRFRLDGLDRATRSRVRSSMLSTYRERRRSGRNATLRSLARAAPGEEEAIETLDFVIEAIENVDLPKDPKRRGRRPNTALRDFIGRLAGIYEEHTHRSSLEGFYRNAMTDRYEGPLVEIAEHLLDRFVPELNITNASIGEHIRRTIGDRSK